MPPVPTPLAAGLGLVASGLGAARELPARLKELPVTALMLGAQAVSAVRSSYDELADRGERLLGRRRAADNWRADIATVEDVMAPFALSDEVVLELAEATPGAVLSHDELPLDDFDHLTIGSLRARLSRLDAVALVQLRDYERAHANRLPVVMLFENRLAKISDPEV